ncbi:hypothetical protein MIND_00031600 [Mycena indigotica]|uniref:Uncharacterized protein n=1 Tax=Mycena indigotica TaxID=2126181 RepID=A0A8H6TEA7_9AGAR|nr:uncharacterized protein MIND_00031600 [Mycena indigotica]KAF7315172.1 hypothetical protein MIND_00031600 [Mycena indigotica]
MLCFHTSRRAGLRYVSRYSTSALREDHLLGERVLSLQFKDPVTSPADALAVVNAVERRFGRVAEFRFSKDTSPSSEYNTTASLAFSDIKTYEQVPKDEQVLLTVNLPPTPALSSGGPSLSDLNPESQTSDDSRTISFSVSHSRRVFQTLKTNPPAYTLRPKIAVELQSNFVRWGGFAPLESSASDSDITPTQAALDDSTIDRPNMRYQLRQWQTTKDAGLQPPPQDESTADQNHPAVTPSQTPSSLPWLSAAPIMDSTSPSSPPSTLSAETTTLSTPSTNEPVKPALNHNKGSTANKKLARDASKLIHAVSLPSPEQAPRAKVVSKPPSKPVVSSPKKKSQKRRKPEADVIHPVQSVPSIEVEERQAGVGKRLRGMLGDWF